MVPPISATAVRVLVEEAKLFGAGQEEEVTWVDSFWMAAKIASFCFLKKINFYLT